MNRLMFIFLYCLVFASGATGLIYQVTWQKYLSRLLGADSIATAIILGTFLGGLSLGYLICGKLSIKIKNHLKAYAILEGIIGVWCLFFPSIFQFINKLTLSWSFEPPILIILQGVICSTCLLGIPTICMGGTLPFLTRGISRNIKEATKVHALIYSVNTAGAFLGTLASGFFLIPIMGLPLTVMSAAIVNLVIFIIFYLFSGFLNNANGKEDSDSNAGTILNNSHSILAEQNHKFRIPSLYMIAFLSGLYVMTLENVLIRITNLSIGSSSYSFTIIVAVFILSIAVGSYFITRIKNISKFALFINQLLITICLLMIYLFLDQWWYYAHIIRVMVQSNIIGFWVYYTLILICLIAVLIVPVGFIGATIPLTFHEIKKDLEKVGKNSGYLLSFNTIGNLLGSLVGGIVLYYFLSNGQIFLVAIVLAAVSSWLALTLVSNKYLFKALIIPIVAIIFLVVNPFYKAENYSRGMFRIRSILPYTLSGSEKFCKQYMKNKLLYYNDGPSATVAADTEAQNSKNPQSFSIYVNGKSDSNTYNDRYTLRLSAHIPALLPKKKKHVMVIGLGTGVTAGELSLYPSIEQIDVAEISPSIVNALPYFAVANHSLHTNPKMRIHIGDAFRVIGRSDKKWDIIISEPSNPWVTGVDLLFTKEFYSLVTNHLTEDGILLQWIHQYAFNRKLLGTVMNTVASEFDNIHVFHGELMDLLIVASKKQFTKDDIVRAEKEMSNNLDVKNSLKELKISNIEELLIQEAWTTSYIKQYFKHSGFQTMDNPRLHYEAGKSFFMGEMDTKPLSIYDTMPFIDEYLLMKYDPGWKNALYIPKDFKDILKLSYTIDIPAKHSGYGDILTRGIMNGLVDPRNYTKYQNFTFFKTYLPLITGEKMKDSSYFNYAETLKIPDDTKKIITNMFEHIKIFQSWIIPYSVKGLKQFLLKKFDQSVDEKDKLWIGLQFLSLLLQENADTNVIDNFIAKLPGKDLSMKEVISQVILINQAETIIELLKDKNRIKDD